MAGLDEGAGDRTVDLDAQRIETGAHAAGFDIDPATRQALMLGLDRIGETLTHADRLRVFEKAYLGRKPWLLGADSDAYKARITRTASGFPLAGRWIWRAHQPFRRGRVRAPAAAPTQ